MKHKLLKTAIQGAMLFSFCMSLLGCAMNTLNPASAPDELGISQRQWNQFSAEKQSSILSDAALVRGPETLADNTPSSTVAVTVNGGTALFPPFTQSSAYAPLQFTLTNDTCKNIAIKQQSGKTTTHMKACYINNSLYLDPSPYRITFQYGIRLPASSLWDRGYTYHAINTFGFVQLKDVQIHIKRKLEQSNE